MDGYAQRKGRVQGLIRSEARFTNPHTHTKHRPGVLTCGQVHVFSCSQAVRHTDPARTKLGRGGTPGN